MIRVLSDNFIAVSLFFYLSLFLTDYSFILPGKGISNIIWPTLIMAFLVYLRWYIDKKSFVESGIFKILTRFNNISEKKILFLSVGIIFLLFSAISITRHISLSSGASDLGIFDQAVWNTSQGRMLFSSLKNNINLLGDHFDPILLPIALLYRLWSNVSVLLMLQAALLASSLIPLYLIAKDRIRRKSIIYAFMAAFMLSRPLRGVAFSDFHPECFIVPILFWAYYFLMKRKNALFLIFLFLLLLCKEDTTFLVMGFGLFICLFQKRFVLGIALLISGLFLWFLETKLLIPFFNPRGTYVYMDRLPLGLTYVDNINAIMANPLSLVKVLFAEQKIKYIFRIFTPLLFLSFFSPRHYILFAIPLLKNLFVNQNFSGFYNISSHYTASIIPFVFVSAIYGAGVFEYKIKKEERVLPIAILIIFSSLLFYGKTDAHQFSRFLYTIKTKRTLEKLSFLKSIPRDASVSANFNLVPHLSERQFIFEWNPQSPTSYITEYVVVDMNLLEYLSREDTAKINQYFKDIAQNGYRKVFANEDGTFLIFRNSDIDKRLRK